MKIDALLETRPWRWDLVYYPNGTVKDIVDANGKSVLVDGLPTAILELVERHIGFTQRVRTHSDRCYLWHHECALVRIKGLEEKQNGIVEPSPCRYCNGVGYVDQGEVPGICAMCGGAGLQPRRI